MDRSAIYDFLLVFSSKLCAYDTVFEILDSKNVVTFKIGLGIRQDMSPFNRAHVTSY